MKHGKPPEYYGGTNLEEPARQSGVKNLVKLFWEELKSGHKPQPKKLDSGHKTEPKKLK